MFCDLHAHSTASDGTDAPEALPALAKQMGLDAIALTDHDTTAGLAACAEAAAALGLPFVPGIELSADPGDPDFAPAPPGDPDEAAPRVGTLHLLGYFVRHDASELAEVQRWLHEARADRNPRIVSRLRDLGVSIDYAEVEAQAGGGVVGRPHIAQVMVKKGYARSIHEAFARYLGEGAAAHVRKDRLSPRAAIEAIHQADGLAVLAHPTQLRLPDPAALEHLVARLADAGLDGIETRHPDHRPADTRRFEALAQRFDLLTTGGSDYHGHRKRITLGSARVPYSEYEHLLAAHEQRCAS